jgi:hypothetical protein
MVFTVELYPEEKRNLLFRRGKIREEKISLKG